MMTSTITRASGDADQGTFRRDAIWERYKAVWGDREGSGDGLTLYVVVASKGMVERWGAAVGIAPLAGRT